MACPCLLAKGPQSCGDFTRSYHCDTALCNAITASVEFGIIADTSSGFDDVVATDNRPPQLGTALDPCT
jgi:hypothetical protein